VLAQPARDVAFRLAIEMVAQLLIELGIGDGALEQRTQASNGWN